MSKKRKADLKIPVWFMIVDHEFRCTLGHSARVLVPYDGYVLDILDKIKALGLEDLENARYLEVWKLRTPRASRYIRKEGYFETFERLEGLEEEEKEEEEEGVQGEEGEDEDDDEDERKKKLKGKGKAKAEKEKKGDVGWPLEPDEKLSVHFERRSPLENLIRVLVRVIPKSDYVNHTNGHLVLDSELVKKYEAYFINVGKFDSGSFKHSDIELNGIYEEWSPPDFVLELEQKLDSKPGVVHEAHNVFESTLNRQSQAAYFGPPDVPSGKPWRDAELLEIIHIACIANGKWEKCWKGPNGSALKEKAANAMFFYRIANQDTNDVHITVQLSNASWPFNLITRCRAVRPVDAQFRKLQPRSDFLVLKSSYPRLLIEVNSTTVKDWPPDLVWMLLQGAAIVRFANAFLDEFKEKKDFVLIAIFIKDNGMAIRHTLFQTCDPQDSQAVYYQTKEFEFDTPIGRVEFTRQLYNFIQMLKRDEKDKGKDSRMPREIKQLINTISRHQEKFGLKSFTIGAGRGSKKTQSRTGGDGDGAGSGGASAAESAELQAHGYKVKPEVIVDSSGAILEPLFKMPSHIITIYQPSDPSNELIAKKTRKESNELKILRRLNIIQPKFEHVVSLLDSFDSFDPQFSWAILPKMATIGVYIEVAPEKLCGKISEVCWGLIKGLAYLHGFCIAHRDIKPNNLLLDQDLCLKIIDFDLALQLEDEDEEVDDRCGTAHWMAPEIEDKLMYSPIKADRWSCGRVILFFLDELRKEDKRLRMIGRKLEAHDPKQRPSLLKWRSWLDAPLSNVANVLKTWERKALRPLRETMEGDNEGNTMFRKVKKRRIIADCDS